MISILTHIGAFVAGMAAFWLLGVVVENMAFRNWWGP